MLIYYANGRTLIYRAPSSEEARLVGALLAGGIVVEVSSDEYRRWPRRRVEDLDHLQTLLGAEAIGDRSTWNRSTNREARLSRPGAPGWFKDGHPAEAIVREELRLLGATPVGARRLSRSERVVVGPGDKVRGKDGRKQRYWLRYLVPSDLDG